MQSFNPFNIDFAKLSAWLTPRALRKTKLGILIKACIAALIYVFNMLLRFIESKLYQLKITSQVCYLERLLNDRFDYTLRRIRIDDAVWHLPFFLYQDAELKPQALFTESENHPKGLFTEGEAGSQALNDFVVLVPSDISFSQAEMRSMIDSFKLFGTIYSIQTV